MLVFISSTAEPFAHSFGGTLLFSLFKGIIAIAVIIGLGQWILRPLFRIIEKTGTIELFTLHALFVAVGSAELTHYLGLSYALGAFLSGIMLAECEHKNKIKNEIRPFRDLLLALFFISTGMLVNITLWAESWFWILLFTIGLMVAKTVLIIVLIKFSRYSLETSIKTGLILAQGGEFGFAILSLALANHLLPAEWGQSVLAALLISFAFASVVIRYNKFLTRFTLSY
jgi:CPA2 family monovalent cation:H+ antiporter-2